MVPLAVLRVWGERGGEDLPDLKAVPFFPQPNKQSGHSEGRYGRGGHEEEFLFPGPLFFMFGFSCCEKKCKRCRFLIYCNFYIIGRSAFPCIRRAIGWSLLNARRSSLHGACAPEYEGTPHTVPPFHRLPAAYECNGSRGLPKRLVGDRTKEQPLGQGAGGCSGDGDPVGVSRLFPACPAVAGTAMSAAWRRSGRRPRVCPNARSCRSTGNARHLPRTRWRTRRKWGCGRRLHGAAHG